MMLLGFAGSAAAVIFVVLGMALIICAVATILMGTFFYIRVLAGLFDRLEQGRRATR